MYMYMCTYNACIDKIWNKFGLIDLACHDLNQCVCECLELNQCVYVGNVSVETSLTFWPPEIYENNDTRKAN